MLKNLKEKKMKEETVRIETLRAFKAVGFTGFGTTPEDQAWKALEPCNDVIDRGACAGGVHRFLPCAACAASAAPRSAAASTGP